MKKLLFLVLSLFLLPRLYATHIAGGELQYTWLRDSTYRIVAKFYRDCSGNAAPYALTLCYQSSCDKIPHTANMRQLDWLPDSSANGSSVSNGCPGFPSNCQDPNSTLPGYAEWWFETDITLPVQCSDWVFSFAINNRNPTTNLAGGSNNPFYVEAQLNSVLAPGNSSPVFTVKPVPFVCVNSPYTFNNGASDANGDSLVYSIIQPREGDCNGWRAIPFFTSNYNTSNNPIPTGNTFSLNPLTGQFTFTPTISGASTLTLQVTEYRKGQRIGSTMRDIQVRTLNCNAVQPVIKIDSLSFTSTAQFVDGQIRSCAGTPVNFCFTVKAPSKTTTFVASDNHRAVTPGASMSYFGQGTDSVRGCFSWIPTAADTGLKIFTVTVKDSTCLPPGISISQSYVLPIYIDPITAILGDTTVCSATSVPLLAIGGDSFAWSVLPGGSPLSTLSCDTCSNPSARPLVTTSYVVVSNLISSCNRNRDTVTVTVVPPPATPVPVSNSPVCVGSAINLQAGVAAASYNWTGPSGFSATTRDPSLPAAQLANSGIYTVTAAYGDCVSQPGNVRVSVVPIPVAPQLSLGSPACEGKPLTIFAQSPDTGVRYIWSLPGGRNFTGSQLDIREAGSDHAGVYTVYAGVGSCFSPTSSITVTPAPGVSAAFEISRDSLCQFDTLSALYTGGTAVLDSLLWIYGGRFSLSGSFPGPFLLRPILDGAQTLTLIARNSSCNDTVSRLITVHPAPPSAITAPAEACIGEILELRATQAMSVPLQYNWDFADATVISGEGRGKYALQFSTPGAKIISLHTEDGNCESNSSATINVHPVPEADIRNVSRTSGICSSDTVFFDAAYTSGNRYRWTPERFFPVQGAQVTGRIGASGFVLLEVSDAIGCRGFDSVAIQTEPCCEVYLPSAFTPNGDGRNDAFRIITIGHQALISFNILNRWGQTVFAAASPADGWDGTIAGRPAELGTYFYYVRYRCSNGQLYEHKGDLVLIR